MRNVSRVGAVAPEHVTLIRDEAVGRPGHDGFNGESKEQYTDCGGSADQDQAQGHDLSARARRLGIELRATGADAWMLRHQRGAAIGVVRGQGALLAALAAFEAPGRDVAALIAARVGRIAA